MERSSEEALQHAALDTFVVPVLVERRVISFLVLFEPVAHFAPEVETVGLPDVGKNLLWHQWNEKMPDTLSGFDWSDFDFANVHVSRPASETNH